MQVGIIHALFSYLTLYHHKINNFILISIDYKSNICIFHITWTCLFLSWSCLRGGVLGKSLLQLAWQEGRNQIKGLPPIRQGLILSPVGAETQFHFTARARMMPVKYTRYSFINQKSFWFIDKNMDFVFPATTVPLALALSVSQGH